MSEIVYEGKGLQFSAYKNVTPYIGTDGYWYVNGDKTDIKAQGADGTSFSGVKEWYRAFIAGAKNDGKPEWADTRPPQQSDLVYWHDTVSKTSFGKRGGGDKLYKYLWNIREVLYTDANSATPISQYTGPSLIQVYEGGRIPDTYINYYAGSQSLTPPDGAPDIKKDGNEIVFPEGYNSDTSPWKTNGAVADALNYLFEITFVKYAEKDENGENLYARIQGPTLIGRNGADALTLSLNNDSDVVAISANGEVSGSLPSVVAALSMNGSSYKGQIALEVDADNWSEEEEGPTSQKGNYTFSQNEDNGTATLTITKLPTNFSEANFTFLYNNISRVFHLTARQSEVDYNLSFEQTLINSSNGEGTIQVKVKKTNASGIVEYISIASQGAASNIYLSYKDGTGNYKLVDPPNSGENVSDQQKWIFSYEEGRDMPLYFKIEEKITKGEGESQLDSWFLWDEEAIEFIKNGQDGEVINKYTLSLDNDYDVVVKGTDEKWVSDGEIKVKATGYEGQTPFNNSDTDKGYIALDPAPSTDGSSYFDYNDETGTLTITVNKIPIKTFTEQAFKFIWKNSSEGEEALKIRDTKTFTLKSITSIADYDLLIPQTVYNLSSNDATIDVQVQKKSNGATTILSGHDDDESIAIYLKTVTTTDGDGDQITVVHYDKQTSSWAIDVNNSNKHIILGSADGGDVTESGSTINKKPSVIWDEEVIEFVSDGTPGANGMNLYILYHDSIDSGAPNEPTRNDYDSYGSEYDSEDKWYKTETAKSRYRVSKIATPENQPNTPWGPVVINIANDGQTGSAGASLEVQYQYAQKKEDLLDGQWVTNVPPLPGEGTWILWMRQKLSGESSYSTPIQISAVDGETPTIEISEDGYWVINNEKSEILAEGQDGKTPTITIENGKWVINGVSSEVEAQGPAGVDGDQIKYIYYLSDVQVTDWSGKAPNEDGSFNHTDVLSNNWNDSPQGITKENPYEYVSIATYTSSEGTTKKTWSNFSNPPVIWSKWGDKGQDGDGIEYRYYILPKNDSGEYEAPTYTDGTKSSWEDNPQGVDKNHPYEYVVQVKMTKNESGTWVEGAIPTGGITGSLWAKWSEDGIDGCTLSLSSDSDTIVRANDGRWISTGTINVTAQGYIGASIDDRGSCISCVFVDSNNNVSDLPGDGELDGNELKITIASLPNTFPGGEFKFTWQLGDTEETITKTFTLKVATGLVDFDLIVPQTVYNKSNLGTSDSKPIPVTVQAKTESGTEVYSAPYNESGNKVETIKNIAVYTKSGETYTAVSDWSCEITYSAGTESITIVLGSADGGDVREEGATVNKAPSIIWDEEVIEFVSNGEKGDPGPSAYTISLEPDFLSVPCNSQGIPTLEELEYPTITPTVYYGSSQRSNWTLVDELPGTTNGQVKYYLLFEAKGITGTIDGNTLKLGYMTGEQIAGTNTYTDRATVTFSYVYQYNASRTTYATKTFEATKRIGNLGAVYCYIESSLGTMFEESLTSSSSTTTTDLTARIFEGTTEIDSTGNTYNYIWHHSDDTNSSPKITSTGKTVTVAVKDLKNKEVWFTTSPKSNSQTT